MSRRSLSLLFALALLGGAGIGTGHADTPEPMRVLFVGNSYTRFNDLPRIVRRISEAIEGGRPVHPGRVTGPGFSLRRHWERARARRRIADGSYDALVLQGHSRSPIESPDELRDYANRFATHAETHGAGVVLFETWARRDGHRLYRRSDVVDDPHEMTERIEEVYLTLGEELDAPVAPVGRAFQQAAQTLRRSRLFRPDGTHPSLAGTYLSACVLYATLTGADPRQTTYRPHPLGRREVAQLRAIAAEAVQPPAASATVAAP